VLGIQASLASIETEYLNLEAELVRGLHQSSAETDAFIRGLIGRRREQRVSAQGVVVSGTDVRVDELATLFGQWFGLLTTFPDEPIGVGARWTVTERQQSVFPTVQMDSRATTTYELRRIDGGMVTISISVHVEADGKSTGFGDPSAAAVGVHLSAEHNGEIIVDLDHVEPRSVSMRAGYEMRFQTERRNEILRIDSTIHQSRIAGAGWR
jgi:hypothetical protein